MIGNDGSHATLLSRRIRANSFSRFQLAQSSPANEQVDMWNQCAQFLRIEAAATSAKAKVRIPCMKSQLLHSQSLTVMVALKNDPEYI